MNTICTKMQMHFFLDNFFFFNASLFLITCKLHYIRILSFEYTILHINQLWYAWTLWNIKLMFNLFSFIILIVINLRRWLSSMHIFIVNVQMHTESVENRIQTHFIFTSLQLVQCQNGWRWMDEAFFLSFIEYKVYNMHAPHNSSNLM